MNDSLGLLAIVAVGFLLLWGFYRVLMAYNPKGDRCEHGRRTAEGEQCEACGVVYNEEGRV